MVSSALDRYVTPLIYIILTQKMEMECLYLYHEKKRYSKDVKKHIFFYSVVIYLLLHILKNRKAMCVSNSVDMLVGFPHV